MFGVTKWPKHSDGRVLRHLMIWKCPYLKIHHHKLIGTLEVGFNSTVGYTDLFDYINKKHQLTEAKIDKVNLLTLHTHLSKM
jgi:hypothetical protein